MVAAAAATTAGQRTEHQPRIPGAETAATRGGNGRRGWGADGLGLGRGLGNVGVYLAALRSSLMYSGHSARAGGAPFFGAGGRTVGHISFTHRT